MYVFCTCVSNNRLVTPVCNTEFLGLHINDSINWNHHIDHISKQLSTVCYIMRNIKSYMPLNTTIIVYYSYFNSIMSYGLPFWGISPYSLKIFRIKKKKKLRIMVGCRSRASRRSIFKKLRILPLASQYIYLLMLFVVNNIDLFKFHSATSIITTRQSTNLHQSSISWQYAKGKCTVWALRSIINSCHISRNPLTISGSSRLL